MKTKIQKRQPQQKPKGKKRGATETTNHDPFIKSSDSKRRRKKLEDEEIDSDTESGGGGSDDDGVREYGVGGTGDGADEEDEHKMETVGEKKLRMTKNMLETVKSLALKRREEEGDESGDDDDEDGDAVVRILQKEQLEDSGRVRRLIASKVQIPETKEVPEILVKHRQTVTAVALSDDDVRGFFASKDGTIRHWDVEVGKFETYAWPSEAILKSHGVKDPQGGVKKHCKQVYALAVSSDSRYLATSGPDRHVHLWDTRTREHVQAFPGHRGSVSCLSFRQGSSELFSGSFDRTVKIWNVEDRAYITTLFGHQSEVISIDCPRRERALTVGRDRTMRLWKIPEESQLIYRASVSALECCCFVSNDAYLSGSDNGSIELWSGLRKKPVCIVKNAHSVSPVEKNDDERIPNGHVEHESSKSDSSQSQSWVSSVALCSNSDLAASGAGNGFVRLWTVESENKGIQPLFDFPLTGYVNSLAFAKSGKFLVAGVGQEPRLGRWGCIRTATNGVALQSLKLSD